MQAEEREAALVDYLRKKAGTNFMTPAQLSEEIPVSAKQQSVLRKRHDFPIAWQEFNGRIHYSVFDIARFILHGEATAKPPASEVASTPRKKTDKPIVRKSKAGSSIETVDMSHLFNLKMFVNHLRDEAAKLAELADDLTQYEKSLSLHEELQSELPQKQHFKKSQPVKT